MAKSKATVNTAPSTGTYRRHHWYGAIVEDIVPIKNVRWADAPAPKRPQPASSLLVAYPGDPLAQADSGAFVPLP